MNRIARYSRYAFHSLPVQLLVIHIKEHPFFLLFWLLLYASVLQFFGVSYISSFSILNTWGMSIF
jgi:hypothetical protein